MKRLNKRELGTQYEEIAAQYLCNQGYRILEQNYRNRFGEIDIIAEKDKIVAYVEIKYRSTNQYGSPLEAVDYRKQKRICRVAMLHYINYTQKKNMQCRFDVIGITGEGTIQHVENAFYYQG